MSEDIVARLRDLASEFPTLDGIMDSEWTNAAAEIERLRAIVEAWLQYSRRAERDIETLRAERDEARRIICHDESYNHKSGVTPREVAIDRGWDCFKEATDER